MFTVLIIFVLTYLICSINPAIILCYLKKGQDIRNLGSGNAGTSNSIRILGKILGATVFILDILKVVIAYFIICQIGVVFKQNLEVIHYAMFMIAAIVGHCFPIYYKFKGGKGVATMLVVGMLINVPIALICIGIGLVIILITRTVSIGSLIGIILYTFIVLFKLPEFIAPVLITSSIIIFKHKANILRIIQGKENKIF